MQLLQRFIAVNPLSAAALAAQGISAQHVSDMSADEASRAAQPLGLPAHSVVLMQRQMQWGQPLDEMPGAVLHVAFLRCRRLEPLADSRKRAGEELPSHFQAEAPAEHDAFQEDELVRLGMACSCTGRACVSRRCA